MLSCSSLNCSEKPGLFAWGINDMGQIGMEEKTVASPVSVPGFKDSIVKDVACGESHTAVLLNNGKLIMLGSNEFGQCGISDESMFSASFHEVHIKDEKFVRVSCGDNFTLAITKSGKIFSCGLNDHWELGFESDGSVRIPTLVTSLFGVPVVSIACGSAHCLALSATGQVFSWGRNKYGNLGLGHTREAKGPHIISSLSGVRIVKVSCGSSHSAVLSSTHRVFLFGQNSFGQCGQEDFENVLRPQEISHLKSELLIGVFCGSFHTVCLTKQRVIFAFGRNNSQQCSASAAHTERIVVPSKVVAPRLSDDKILFIACSSDSTFAIIQDHSKAISFDSEIDEEVDIKDSSYVSLPMNPLYHVDGRKISLLTKALASTLNYSRILKTVCSVFSSLEALNGSFLSSDQKNMNEFFSSGLQLQAIQPAFDAVYDLSVPEVTNALTRSISSCLEIALKNVNLIKFPAALRFIIILYENPKLRNPAYSKSILKSLNMTVASLSESMQMQLIRWMSRTEVRILRGWIDTIQTSLSDYFEDKPRIDEFVVSCVLMLKILNNANELRDEKIPFQAFTSNVISRSKVVDLKLDYRNWLSYLHTSEESSSRQFLFCRFPFLLDIVAKQEIIQFDAELRMQYEAQKLISQSLWFSPVNPFLIIQVRRSHLREDTLNAINQVLSMNQSILKRPLKVKFMGEEGIDEGGVKKEFFQLIVKELFLEDFGMFLHNEEQRHFWFNQDSFESEQEFQLIGVILGLAIYNSINLDVHFPLVVYKKLCGMTLTYKDLQFLDPRMYASLLEILSFVGDVENTFCLNFTVTRDYYGSLRTHELKEGGTHISVDNSNREEYVNCLSLYIMETSIKKQVIHILHFSLRFV